MVSTKNHLHKRVKTPTRITVAVRVQSYVLWLQFVTRKSTELCLRGKVTFTLILSFHVKSFKLT